MMSPMTAFLLEHGPAVWLAVLLVAGALAALVCTLPARARTAFARWRARRRIGQPDPRENIVVLDGVLTTRGAHVERLSDGTPCAASTARDPRGKLPGVTVQAQGLALRVGDRVIAFDGPVEVLAGTHEVFPSRPLRALDKAVRARIAAAGELPENRRVALVTLKEGDRVRARGVLQRHTSDATAPAYRSASDGERWALEPVSATIPLAALDGRRAEFRGWEPRVAAVVAAACALVGASLVGGEVAWERAQQAAPEALAVDVAPGVLAIEWRWKWDPTGTRALGIAALIPWHQEEAQAMTAQRWRTRAPVYAWPSRTLAGAVNDLRARRACEDEVELLRVVGEAMPAVGRALACGGRSLTHAAEVGYAVGRYDQAQTAIERARTPRGPFAARVGLLAGAHGGELTEPTPARYFNDPELAAPRHNADRCRVVEGLERRDASFFTQNPGVARDVANSLRRSSCPRVSATFVLELQESLARAHLAMGLRNEAVGWQRDAAQGYGRVVTAALERSHTDPSFDRQELTSLQVAQSRVTQLGYAAEFDLDDPGSLSIYRCRRLDPFTAALLAYWRGELFQPPPEAPEVYRSEAMRRVIAAAESGRGSVIARALGAPTPDAVVMASVVAKRVRREHGVLAAWLRGAITPPGAEALSVYDQAVHLQNLKVTAHRLGQSALEREVDAYLQSVRMALLGDHAWVLASLDARQGR